MVHCVIRSIWPLWAVALKGKKENYCLIKHCVPSKSHRKDPFLQKGSAEKISSCIGRKNYRYAIKLHTHTCMDKMTWVILTYIMSIHNIYMYKFRRPQMKTNVWFWITISLIPALTKDSLVDENISFTQMFLQWKWWNVHRTDSNSSADYWQSCISLFSTPIFIVTILLLIFWTLLVSEMVQYTVLYKDEYIKAIIVMQIILDYPLAQKDINIVKCFMQKFYSSVSEEEEKN